MAAKYSSSTMMPLIITITVKEAAIKIIMIKNTVVTLNLEEVLQTTISREISLDNFLAATQILGQIIETKIDARVVGKETVTKNLTVMKNMIETIHIMVDLDYKFRGVRNPIQINSGRTILERAARFL